MRAITIRDVLEFARAEILGLRMDAGMPEGPAGASVRYINDAIRALTTAAPSETDAESAIKDAQDESRRLRQVIASARATIVEPAGKNATDAEWARQARAALHVLTLPEAWPRADEHAHRSREHALLQAAMAMRGAFLAQFSHHTLAPDTIEAIEAFDALASGADA